MLFRSFSWNPSTWGRKAKVSETSNTEEAGSNTQEEVSASDNLQANDATNGEVQNLQDQLNKLKATFDQERSKTTKEIQSAISQTGNSANNLKQAIHASESAVVSALEAKVEGLREKLDFLQSKAQKSGDYDQRINEVEKELSDLKSRVTKERRAFFESAGDISKVITGDNSAEDFKKWKAESKAAWISWRSQKEIGRAHV